MHYTYTVQYCITLYILASECRTVPRSNRNQLYVVQWNATRQNTSFVRVVRGYFSGLQKCDKRLI